MPTETLMACKTVTLYAAGSTQMKKLREVAEAMSAYSANDVSIETISDLAEMAKAQITHLPAVAVDGVVVCTGRVPAAEELRRWVNPESEAA